jgi:hypothetical protein
MKHCLASAILRARKQTLRLVSVLNHIVRHPIQKPKSQKPKIFVHLRHRTNPIPRQCLFYTMYFCPWNGDQIPLTLSFKLLTGFVIFFSFSPLALRSNSAFSRISLGVMLRTQMAFSLPQMYLPLSTGWRPGRGETVTSTWGLARAKSLSWVLRNSLWNLIRDCYRREAVEEAYFIPLLLPAQSQ